MIFAYPVMFAVGARVEPRSLPLLHRIEYSIERRLVNPLLVVVLGAGIFLASDGHHWSEFFVQWGLAAVIVIGALVGAVTIPTSKAAEQLAEAHRGDGDGELQIERGVPRARAAAERRGRAAERAGAADDPVHGDQALAAAAHRRAPRSSAPLRARGDRAEAESQPAKRAPGMV